MNTATGFEKLKNQLEQNIGLENDLKNIKEFGSKVALISPSLKDIGLSNRLAGVEKNLRKNISALTSSAKKRLKHSEKVIEQMFAKYRKIPQYVTVAAEWDTLGGEIALNLHHECLGTSSTEESLEFSVSVVDTSVFLVKFTMKIEDMDKVHDKHFPKFVGELAREYHNKILSDQIVGDKYYRCEKASEELKEEFLGEVRKYIAPEREEAVTEKTSIEVLEEHRQVLVQEKESLDEYVESLGNVPRFSAEDLSQNVQKKYENFMGELNSTAHTLNCRISLLDEEIESKREELKQGKHMLNITIWGYPKSVEHELLFDSTPLSECGRSSEDFYVYRDGGMDNKIVTEIFVITEGEFEATEECKEGLLSLFEKILGKTRMGKPHRNEGSSLYHYDLLNKDLKEDVLERVHELLSPKEKEDFSRYNESLYVITYTVEEGKTEEEFVDQPSDVLVKILTSGKDRMPISAELCMNVLRQKEGKAPNEYFLDKGEFKNELDLFAYAVASVKLRNVIAAEEAEKFLWQTIDILKSSSEKVKRVDWNQVIFQIANLRCSDEFLDYVGFKGKFKYTEDGERFTLPIGHLPVLEDKIVLYTDKCEEFSEGTFNGLKIYRWRKNSTVQDTVFSKPAGDAARTVIDHQEWIGYGDHNHYDLIFAK